MIYFVEAPMFQLYLRNASKKFELGKDKKVCVRACVRARARASACVFAIAQQTGHGTSPAQTPACAPAQFCPRCSF